MRSLIFILIACGFSQTMALSTEWKSYSHSQAKMVSSLNTLALGDVAYVGLWIKLPPGWHSYWENPGDSGSAPILKWDLPEGIEVSEILWPTPQRVEASGLQTFGYSGEVFILQKLIILNTLELKEIPLKLHAEWLVCADICVPQREDYVLNLPIDLEARASVMDEDLKPYVTEALRRLPTPNKSISVQWKKQEKVYELQMRSSENIEPVDFFAGAGIPVDAQKPRIRELSEHEWLISMDKVALSNANLEQLSGLLFFREKNNDKAPLEAHPVLLEQPFLPQLWQYILWAFLGGLILNLMPCVLPIIMLKAFSLLKNSQASLSTVRKESFLYTLGVILSFWLLALVIIALQKAGHLVGWGFQLQSPFFNVFLLIIFIAMACNLLGLFEIQVMVPSRFQKWLQMDGGQGALATGFLSVIVASPCTAPFMGVAIGFALSQSLPVILAIFTSLGVGLSLPYLLIAFVPQTVGLLPKPGPWMETFKKVLALPLLLTALWLGWVFYQQVSPVSKSVSHSELKWLDFNKVDIAELKGKKAFFIDFTAGWCISCKVNEGVVFNNSTVLAELQSRDVVLIKADWTNYDPIITSWLKNYNRAGVPFYIFFHENGREEILPEILTPNIFLNSLSKINYKKKENKK